MISALPLYMTPSFNFTKYRWTNEIGIFNRYIAKYKVLLSFAMGIRKYDLIKSL